jgi:hypothetical protein
MSATSEEWPATWTTTDARANNRGTNGMAGRGDVRMKSTTPVKELDDGQIEADC